MLEVLPKRFGKYGLSLHPDKTRLVPFQRPSGKPPAQGPEDGNRPGTFDLLGFTHYWALSRKGNWVVKQRTAQGRLSRAIKTIAQWCRLNRHQPIAEQHRTLSQKLRGHFVNYGITGNSTALTRLRVAVTEVWRKWLARRRRCGLLPRVVFKRLLKHYPLPPPLAVHSVCRLVGEPAT